MARVSGGPAITCRNESVTFHAGYDEEKRRSSNGEAVAPAESLLVETCG
ncbi:MAG: hypothetical protein RIG61_05275 [Deltaproteobacteria bacterium]